MRLHRFYTHETLANHGRDSKDFTLPDQALAHQLRSVFRLRSGAQVILFDGSNTDYTAEIVSFGKDEATFRIVSTRAVKPVAKRRLTLAFSLIKKDNAEWVIEKGTELGVAEFIPLVSERSEKKGFNMERAQKKMIEACEQSGRSEIALIHEPLELADFVAQIKERKDSETIVFHTDGDAMDFDKGAQVGEKVSGGIIACIGPEGGWSDNDVALFTKAGARAVKLSAPVLRAETASVAIAALLLI